MLRGFLGGWSLMGLHQECLLKVCTATVEQLQKQQQRHVTFAHHTFKDEQTLFWDLEIITILISTCASEKIQETLLSAVTTESIAAVIR